MDTVAEGEGGINWGSDIDIYTLAYVKQIASGKLMYSTETQAWSSATTSRGGMGVEVQGSRGRADSRMFIYVYVCYLCMFIYVYTADLHCCMPETNTTL